MSQIVDIINKGLSSIKLPILTDKDVEYDGNFVKFDINAKLLDDKTLQDIDNYYTAQFNNFTFKGQNGIYKVLLPLIYNKIINNLYIPHVNILIPLKKMEIIKTNNYEESYELPFNYKINDIIFGKILGSGSYGTVYQAISKIQPAQKYAIKSFSNKSGNLYVSKLIETSFLKEVALMIRLNHPNIINIIDIIYSRHNSYLFEEMMYIMPLANNDLYHYTTTMYNSKNINYDILNNITYQILSALLYMHDRDVIHGDLKDENILVYLPTNNNYNYPSNLKNNGIPMIKITDFGLSDIINCGPDDMVYTLNSYSPQYRPLEVYLRESYGIEADYWALGCILYFLYTGEDLFKLDPIKKPLKEVEANIIKDIFNKLGDPEVYYPEILNIKKYDDYKYLNTKNINPSLDYLINSLTIDDTIKNIIKNTIVYNPAKRMNIINMLNTTLFKNISVGYNYNNVKIDTCTQALNIRTKYLVYKKYNLNMEDRNYYIKKIEIFCTEQKISKKIFFLYVYIFDYCMNPLIDKTNIIYYSMACLAIAYNYIERSTFLLYIYTNYLDKIVIDKIVIDDNKFVNMIYDILKIIKYDLSVNTIYDHLLEYISQDNNDYDDYIKKIIEYVYNGEIFKELPGTLIKKLGILLK